VLLGLPAPGIGRFDLSAILGPEALAAASAGGDFSFLAPVGRRALNARHFAATDPAGNPVVRVIVLREP
jgi:hypothetical protein